MAAADLVSIPCLRGVVPYLHYGIDLGDGTVVHLATQQDGKSMSVQRVSLADFACGKPIRVEHTEIALPIEVVVQNCMGALGRTGYHLIWDNCEHFAREMKTGIPRSHQVEVVVKSVMRGAVTGVAYLLGRHSFVKTAMAASKVRLAASAAAMVPTLVGESVRYGTYAAARCLNVPHHRANLSARGAGYAATAVGGLAVAGPAGAAAALAFMIASDHLEDRLECFE